MIWTNLYDIMRRSTRVHIPVFTLLVCVLVLVGWQLGIGWVVRPVPGLDAINPLSAIAFMFSAVALLVLMHKPHTGVWRLVSQGSSWAVVLIGGLRIVDIATGGSFNIDRWLFSAQLLADTGTGALPNRMGLIAAIGFFLLGLSLYLSSYRQALVRRASNVISFSVMWLGLVLLLGYVYRVHEFYYLLQYAPLSVIGTVLFALVGRATLSIHPDSPFLQTFSSPYLGGILARRFVPVILLAPGLIAYAGLHLYWVEPYSAGLGVATLIATIVTVLFSLIWFLAIRLNNSDKARTESEEALKEFNKNLEELVVERTEKVIKLSRLNSFLSAINQAIVHTTTQQQLMDNVCKTATTIGQFKMAWAGLINEHGKLCMVSVSGPAMATFSYEPGSIIDFTGPAFKGSMIANAIQTGKYVLSNDVQTDPAMAHRLHYLQQNQIHASIALPVKKFGQVAGLLAFHSTVKNFFDEAELALLQEAANDVSFALEYIHNEQLRQQAETEIKTLNENLERKVKERTTQLSNLNKELEKFSVTVSHDLQAPLRAIHGFSRILLDDYNDKLDDEGREFLGIIDTNVLRMSDLIRDLLDFSRMGKPMKIKLTDMTELATIALKEIQTNTSRVRAHVEIAAMPPAVCDQALMLQVWTNLISNAIKYSSKAEHPEIEIGLLTKEDEPVYYVRDNGVGFDMESADKMFQPFNRFHGVSEFEGTGIGLSTVHRIINRHGGRIWAESKVNQGATFYFTLP